MTAAPQSPPRHGERSRLVRALTHSLALVLSCLAAYWLTTTLLSRLHSLSSADDLLGGMWAVIATVFVYRTSYQDSIGAAATRMVATLLSFVLCLIYLLLAPFHPWGLALLIAAGTFVLMLMGRDGDVITAAITTTVILVVAAVSPAHAWQQPILRLADTVVGVAVGIAGAFTALRFPTVTTIRVWPRRVDENGRTEVRA